MTTNIEIGSNLSVNGTSTLTGNVSLGNNLSVTGTSTFTGNVTCQDNLTVDGTINNNITQTTITGSTAGSLVCSMPYQGSSYKKVIIYCDGYENDTTTAQSYTFPVTFTNTPITTTNTSGLPGTITTTSISFNPDNTTTYTGYIILEGY